MNLSAKRNYEKRLAKNARKNNAKLFYSYMKRRTCNQVSVGPLKDSSGQLVTDDESMAEILNEFFCSVFTREDATDVPIAEQLYHEEEPLVLVQITSAQVQKKLNSLKPNSTLGPDKLWPRVQQKLASVIATLLAIVHTICLAEGVVPSDWKATIVTPIFKKGSRGTPKKLQTRFLDMCTVQDHGEHHKRSNSESYRKTQSLKELAAWIHERKINIE